MRVSAGLLLVSRVCRVCGVQVAKILGVSLDAGMSAEMCGAAMPGATEMAGAAPNPHTKG